VEWTGALRSVLDLGANNGIGSLYFATRHPAARIVAIEPDASSYACLLANVAGLPNVETRRLCVADRKGVVHFAEEGPSDARRIADGGAVEVEADTMTGILDEAGLDRISFLKMDIEGAEQLALQSADEWIDRVDWAIIEFHFDSADLVAARESLLGHERRLYFHDARAGRWREIDATAADALPGLVDTLDVLIAPASAGGKIR
jgi:FkbM family methyltransferase